MRFVGNIVHLLTGGIFLCLGWFFAGLLYRIPAVTRPLAGPCFELARLCLWPAGKEAVRTSHVEQYRCYLRTGRSGERAIAELSPGTRLIQAVLWLPAAVLLLLGHVLHGLLLALPVLANPWEARNFSLLGPAAFPLGVRVAEPAQARAMRAVGISRRGPLYPPPIRPDHPVTLACRRVARPMATIGAACLILWASSSNNEAHLHPQTATLQVLHQLAMHGMGNPFGGSPIPGLSDPRLSPPKALLGRPHASPPLPLAPILAAPLPASAGPCSVETPAVAVATAHLSRKHADYGAQPLGSLQIRMDLPLGGPPTALRHAVNVQRWVGSVGHGKASSLLCSEALALKVMKSTDFAARSAAAQRLARKAAPVVPKAIAGRALSHIGPAHGHAAQLRHVAKLQQWTRPPTFAKADAVLATDRMAEKVARSAALPGKPVLDYRSASKAVRDAVLPRAPAEHAPAPLPPRLQHVADLTAKLGTI